MSTTTNYGLTKPTVGASDSTWGATLNLNLDTLDTTIKAVSDFAIPTGGIIMWSGAISAIPTGWALCNGLNGTPNLTGKFVVMADADASGTYNVNDTGGVDSVTLTDSQIPAHSHTASTDSQGSHTHSGSTDTTGSHSHTETHYTSNGSGDGVGPGASCCGGGPATSALSTSSAGSHSHTLSISSAGAHTHTVTVSNTGGGGSHENRPPYYALAYIMKLAA